MGIPLGLTFCGRGVGMAALCEIRADFDHDTIVVYQAYPREIAGAALQHGTFVAPFSFGRMTWVKPSFLWLMERSNWGQKSGQEYILAVRLTRKGWEEALSLAVLTHPEKRVYLDHKDWNRQFKTALVHVQWDPERSLRGEALGHNSIQVGLSRHVTGRYVQEWITEIRDLTPLTRKLSGLIKSGNAAKAKPLLPREAVYPLDATLAGGLECNRHAPETMLPSLIHNQFKHDSRVLVAGAGGGYDVVCGLPLSFALETAGCQVHLASFSSTPLNDIAEAVQHTETLWEVTADSVRPSYFPEGWLVRWFRERQGRELSLWCFGASGVGPYHESYQFLVERLGIDTILVTDGGVDSLLRGDEYSLASPLEDALTLAAVSLLDGPKKLLAATAFGAERLDNISHAQVLARIATLTATNALLGVSTLLPSSAEGQAFTNAAEYILSHQQGMHQSVVISSLLSALRGDFGDQTVNRYTQNTPPWVSPLMCLYWFFDLQEVARQNLYLSRLLTTQTFPDAAERLHEFMKTRTKRGWESIPI